MNAATTIPQPWLPPASSRPLHWWSEARLQCLREALASVLRRWAEAWGLAGLEAAFDCSAAGEPAPASWLVLQRDGRALAWLQVLEGGADSLLPLMFPHAGRIGPWARALAGTCAADASARLASALRVEPGIKVDGLPADLVQPLSGVVHGRAADPLGWRLVLAQELAAELVPPRVPGASVPGAALASALEAASAQPLQLTAGLEACELALGELQALQTGDVLRLRHRLDRPAQLCDGSGSVLCAAYLGQQGGQRAVELATA